MEQKEKTQFGIRFGAMVFPIRKQLEDQGIVEFDKEEIKHFQQDADAVCRLRIRAILSLSQCRAAEQKIIARISKHLSTYKSSESKN